MNKPTIIARLEQSARRRRFRLFGNLLSNIVRPEQRTKILDVGGTMTYWLSMDWTTLGNIDVVLLNVFPQEGLPSGFTSVVGDARDLSSYADQEFDTVYSNSAIGHVGTLLDQERMAREIRRVGKSYFVQTPNQEFVIDWRTLVPFFHRLSVPSQAWCLRHVRVGTYPRINDYSASLRAVSRVRNLRFRELKSLFPDGTIVREKVAGLTKSFVVHSGFVVPSEAISSTRSGRRETYRGSLAQPQ